MNRRAFISLAVIAAAMPTLAISAPRTFKISVKWYTSCVDSMRYFYEYNDGTWKWGDYLPGSKPHPDAHWEYRNWDARGGMHDVPRERFELL